MHRTDLTVTKRVKWEMAHRLDKDYPGACKSLHGHTYIAEMTFGCARQDDRGMVIDFNDVKRFCKKWIDGHLDHSTMCGPSDGDLLRLLKEEDSKFVHVAFTPTVECIVRWLALALNGCLRYEDLDERGVHLVALRVYETSDSWCDWRAE